MTEKGTAHLKGDLQVLTLLQPATLSSVPDTRRNWNYCHSFVVESWYGSHLRKRDWRTIVAKDCKVETDFPASTRWKSCRQTALERQLLSTEQYLPAAKWSKFHSCYNDRLLSKKTFQKPSNLKNRFMTCGSWLTLILLRFLMLCIFWKIFCWCVRDGMNNIQTANKQVYLHKHILNNYSLYSMYI